MCNAKCFHALVWEYCVSNGKYWICICRSIRKLITKRVIIRIGENAPKMMSHYDWHGLWLSSCQVNTRGFQSRTDHIAHHSKHSRLIDSEFPIFFSLHISMFAFGFWSTEICKYCKWLVRGCFSQIELHKFYWYLFFFVEWCSGPLAVWSLIWFFLSVLELNFIFVVARLLFEYSYFPRISITNYSLSTSNFGVHSFRIGYWHVLLTHIYSLAAAAETVHALHTVRRDQMWRRPMNNIYVLHNGKSCGRTHRHRHKRTK